MPRIVAVLEGDSDRILEMEASLATALPGTSQAFFDNASELIEWLKSNLGDVVLISLEHDLPIVQYRMGRRVDTGSGRDVADYLSALPPTCPVIVHATDADRGAGMEHVLHDGGWPCRRVHPFEEYEWVRKAWVAEILSLVKAGWIGGDR